MRTTRERFTYRVASEEPSLAEAQGPSTDAELEKAMEDHSNRLNAFVHVDKHVANSWPEPDQAEWPEDLKRAFSGFRSFGAV